MDPSKCFERTSKLQNIIVVDTGESNGRVLYIDCMFQSSEADESVYHETLVHSAMLAHPTGALKIFIAGGGEGATAREVSQHLQVTKNMKLVMFLDFVVCSFGFGTVEKGPFVTMCLRY